MKHSLPLRRNFLPGLLVAFTATASTLSLVAPPAHAGLFSISEKEEIEAGRQTAAQARKQFGGSLPYNNPMSVRVRAIGARIAALSERKNIPYSYEVLRDEKVLNAFAAPGGPVFVTRKLVETTANDAELAYVLGHETGHINQKHIVKAVEKQQKVGLGVGILGAVLGGGKGSNIFQVFGNVAFTVWTRGYSRDQESEADTVGVRYMSRLGFDPRAAISMLKKLDTGDGGGVDKYLATHPAPKDRENKVAEQIQKENLVQVATKAGGPFLTAQNLPTYDYRNTSASLNTAPDTEDTLYPDSDTSIGDDDDDTGTGSARRAAFGAPVVMASQDRYNVVMAPVGGFARWARADMSADDDNSNYVIVRRGRFSIHLRPNSREATINGRRTTMSSPASVYNDLLYAPLGSLAEGVGATASLSSDNSTIWLSLDGQRWYVNLR
jgi:Zn-dependent protease with chaperone function